MSSLRKGHRGLGFICEKLGVGMETRRCIRYISEAGGTGLCAGHFHSVRKEARMTLEAPSMRD